MSRGSSRAGSSCTSSSSTCPVWSSATLRRRVAAGEAETASSIETQRRARGLGRPGQGRPGGRQHRRERAAPRCGTVTIRLIAEGDGARVTVTDEGEGISAEALPADLHEVLARCTTWRDRSRPVHRKGHRRGTRRRRSRRAAADTGGARDRICASRRRPERTRRAEARAGAIDSAAIDFQGAAQVIRPR